MKNGVRSPPSVEAELLLAKTARKYYYSRASQRVVPAVNLRYHKKAEAVQKHNEDLLTTLFLHLL